MAFLLTDWLTDWPLHSHNCSNNFNFIYSGAPAAEGRQAEPYTHIRELKGTHELIFSCVPWLAVLLVGAYARRRRPRRRWSRATWRPYSNNRLTETCSLGLLVLLWYRTSMLWSTDTCQNKVSADQYHVTISRAQVYNSSRSRVFPKLTADQMMVFRLDCGLMSG